ncbi:NAD(P)/FAD-dependent oxidoreductase [Geoalkalibacter sp.]|uniref:NAD(P)/FAD-dependent oxidoreductase n=1 Tax=Geoalkalibacter sp. TaxID=3041440 RepID=UPI00272E1CCE|nr:NAD(P)/FAD-dependent oxidoreductase [Geoalkalibacter sp.]
MAWRLNELRLDLEQQESELRAVAARLLGVTEEQILNPRVVRRAVDARQKPRVRRVFSLEFDLAAGVVESLSGDASRRLEKVAPVEVPPLRRLDQAPPVVVVGMGPAGLFAAWNLARSGVAVTLIERGKPVEERVRDVRRFWQDGVLDAESNVQFGEGGAGTFSDGKLTTRLNHPWIRLVLQALVECGAPEDILVQAKPHVGTDRLRLVLINLRRQLENLGVRLRFQTRLVGLVRQGQKVAGALLADGSRLDCEALVLAPGHSARDTYRMLAAADVALEAKDFALGVRVEHPAELINSIQYGLPRHPQLPAAEYSLAWNDPQSGRGVYSFCMCPGGEVINSASEARRLVVNGMSSLRRSGSLSNSALVVSVRRQDFPADHVLGGLVLQEQLESAAFVAGGGDYCAPAQNLLSFLGHGRGSLRSSCRPGVREADLAALLPEFVTSGLRRALPHFERRMRGFITAEATLVGVETRTSAPLRILRGEDGQSLSHPGLFPCGEGAGYAGGIMSAALDGLRVAEAIMTKMINRSAQ